MNTLRVAFVTNVLSHYRVPCFQVLAEDMRENITFFFLSESMAHRGYVLEPARGKVRATWLKGRSWHRPPNDDKHLNQIGPVVKNQPDVIILGGWDEPSYLLLWLYGALKRKQVLFWVESTLREERRRGLKECYKRVLLKRSAGCIVPGRRAFEYCLKLGMPAERIFVAPNATNRIYFSGQAAALRPRRAEVREELGLNGVTALFVGRLVDEYKRVSTLIEAFEKISASLEEASLLIVGDGPDRARYEAMARERGLGGIRFLGELPHQQLCRVYAAADLQVLPSRVEPWGFVLNEGMEFGLPLIVSDAVGAGPDLVREGRNGFVFPVGNVGALRKHLVTLAGNPDLRAAMGEASRQMIKSFSPEAWARGVMAAIGSTAECSIAPQHARGHISRARQEEGLVP